jgi:hypothetical protein
MPLLDREGLTEEFNMTEEPIEAEVVEDENEPDPFEEEWEHENTPQTKIEENIERANSILDLVEEELRGGNFSARLVEVAAGLINAVTAAGKELITDRNYKLYLQTKYRMVELQKEKLEWQKSKSLTGGRTTNNLIVAKREDVLKLLEKKKCEEKETPSGTVVECTDEE